MFFIFCSLIEENYGGFNPIKCIFVTENYTSVELKLA